MNKEKKVPSIDGAKRLLNAIEETARLLGLLLDQQEEIAQKLDTLATKEQVEELAGEVDTIKDVVSRHSSDISQLKKAQ